jgi:hypothetical protein
MKEQLPIPGWLPLVSKHLMVLEACVAEPQVVLTASFAPRHHLESLGLICCAIPESRSIYIATEKGLRALRAQRIMKELGIMLQRRPLARFPDNDLVRLVALLENMVAEQRRVLSAMQSAPRHS